jgi:hypothetical protein
MRGRQERLSETLTLILNLVEEADQKLMEEPQLHRRDPMSRMERRIREAGTPLTRDVLRARRERKARSRYQTTKNLIAPPRKTLSTRLRTR